MNYMKPIKLCKLSQKQAIKICEKLTEEAFQQTYREMAIGMGDSIRRYGALTNGQANWLCKNCDYHDYERPWELRYFRVRSVKRSRRGSSRRASA
jgi:hypothetical protein